MSESPFKVHRLNATGMGKAIELQHLFEGLPARLEVMCPEGRELAIVRTKLEEASFFAKKAMAKHPEHQE
jgi:hypothetical protein